MCLQSRCLAMGMQITIKHLYRHIPKYIRLLHLHSENTEIWKDLHQYCLESSCVYHQVGIHFMKSFALFSRPEMLNTSYVLSISFYGWLQIYRVILNYCRVSVAYKFQTGKNKVKLLTEYDSETKKVLLPIESMLQNAKQLQHARFPWHVRRPRFLDSINIFLWSAWSSRSFSAQNTTSLLKLLYPTSDSIIWRWICSILSSVTTLRFDNGFYFEKPKYEVWRHIFSQTSMRWIQRCQINFLSYTFIFH
jgi:hypothetical protein